MSNKKYEHWCDDKHQEPKNDNKFVIILADYFNIPIECVICSKYSYIIIDKEECQNENDTY